jgi:aspartate ammonia-lyase
MVPFGKSFVWGIYKTFLKDHRKQIKVAISSFIGQVNLDSSSIGTCLMNSISFADQNKVLRGLSSLLVDQFPAFVG